MIGLAVSVLALSVSTPVQCVLEDDQVVQQDVQDEETPSGRETPSLKAMDAIPATAQVSLQHEYCLIDILPELEEPQAEPKPKNQFISKANKVFKILFCRIISPNAP
ncbi:hypothetical protein C7460_12453 [Marinoscillum furvescens DSM 4134]|uniref:Uncharacterized protein n=2 Tax=Marinoscillum furvescens TaxID=1026 RepID=A0A3D9KZD9_MARFU|nr:hypothetical protein C7460_12453 [Marinoscillum furvescens DSM 4134]